MVKARAERVTLRDPAAIKALAHPARLAVLDELMSERELTATEIAESVGMSPSAMSYHLRQLARWKIVVPAESDDGRERRWRLNPGGFAIEPEHPRASAAAEATLISAALERQQRDVLAWFNSPEAENPMLNELAMIATSYLWLTEAEMRSINDRFQATVEEFSDRNATDHPADARRVQIGFVSVPAVEHGSGRR